MKKSSRIFVNLAVCVLASGLIAARAPLPTVSASLPSAVVLTQVISGLTAPVLVTNAGDGSNRIFIVQQTGQVRVFKNGSLLSTPFLNIASLSNFTGLSGEMGLLGLAFDPHFASNRFFYITYDISTGNATFPYAVQLVRYQASTGNPDVADPSTAFPVLRVPKKYTNHNGGMLAFGPDGYLYWGTGDGGSGGDPDNNAQTLSTLLGKMLRIDVDSTPPSGKKYVIPPTNPFFGSSDTSIRQEIWAMGLRNPWRFSFDRSTGDLYIGDVGQNIEEEVDFQPASSTGGENYGWHILEGNLCYDPSTGCVQPSNYVAPVATYDHGTGDSFGCALTGGYVYRGTASPSLQGVYFYGDYCSGKLLAMVRTSSTTWSSAVIANTGYNISAFGQDEHGELYVVNYGTGKVYRISQVRQSASFVSEASLDGTVVESSENSNAGGTLNSTSPTFSVGDTRNRRQVKGILSFNTSGLPDTAVITLARLRIKPVSITNPSPFAVLGKLLVDMAVPRFGSSVGLEVGDFQAPATKSSVAAFGANPNSAGWYVATLSSTGRASINRLGRTQFRLAFTLDDNNDSVANRAMFASGNATTATDRPVLVVQYYVP